jgi:hypothetical protein
MTPHSWHFILTTQAGTTHRTTHGRMNLEDGWTETDALTRLLRHQQLPEDVVILFYRLVPDAGGRD